MRRKDRETSEDMAWAIFDKANHAVISVVDQAGKPYSVPMLVARKERSVYYHSFFRGHMYEIMETSPDVCITSISIASVVPKSNDLVFASAILFGKGADASKAEHREYQECIAARTKEAVQALKKGMLTKRW